MGSQQTEQPGSKSEKGPFVDVKGKHSSARKNAESAIKLADDASCTFVKSTSSAEDTFCTAQVEQVLRDVLEAYLRGVRYSAQRCSRLAHDLCGIVKVELKKLQLQGFKLVTHVVIGQDCNESVQVASRCLWNHETDNFAAATYRNSSLYAVCVVYGLKHEFR